MLKHDTLIDCPLADCDYSSGLVARPAITASTLATGCSTLSTPVESRREAVAGGHDTECEPEAEYELFGVVGLLGGGNGPGHFVATVRMDDDDDDDDADDLPTPVSSQGRRRWVCFDDTRVSEHDDVGGAPGDWSKSTKHDGNRGASYVSRQGSPVSEDSYISSDSYILFYMRTETA